MERKRSRKFIPEKDKKLSKTKIFRKSDKSSNNSIKLGTSISSPAVVLIPHTNASFLSENGCSLVKESDDQVLHINSLPEEVIIKIFSYLKHNELCRIARVCKQWKSYTKCPLLWRRVDILFPTHYRHRFKASKNIIEKLPSCVTHIKLDFRNGYNWYEPLMFEEFSAILQEKCPNLQTLILRHAQLTDTLPSIIDLCTQFLKYVQVLVLHCCLFADYSTREQYEGISKIQVLDVSGCFLGHFNKPPFSKMPHLRELYLARTNVLDNSWFNDEASFLNNLQVLDLGCTETDSRTFLTIQHYGFNLKELNVSRTHLEDYDFKDTFFPYLQTISLRYCRSVTCESIISLIHSCPYLNRIYVHKDIAETFPKHPFVVANKSRLENVKVIDFCVSQRDYLYE